MRNRTVLAALSFLLLAAAAFGQERVVFGEEDNWSRLLRQERIVRVPGRSGYLDLQLEAFAHAPDESTELLLQFDAEPLRDAAGNFTVDATAPELATTIARTGASSLLVDSPSDRLHLRPGPESIFTPGIEWGSFTMEFWLYPVHVSDGDVLFAWEATDAVAGDFRSQAARAVIEAGRVVFEFQNFFVPPDGRPFTLRLEGSRSLIPRRWSHHAVRFDGRTGLFEYVRDGSPEAVTYASRSGRQDGSVYYPRIAASSPDGLVIADGMIGAVDEFRIVRRFVDELAQPEYAESGGSIFTEFVDLGSTGARPEQIVATYNAPGLSEVFLFYRASDLQSTRLPESEEAWQPVRSGELIDGVNGRFVQLRADLYPDPVTSQTPTLSSIELRYVPDPAPLPPTFVQATPMDGAVMVEWAPVLDPDVAGYQVFYGTQSGRYFGTRSESGPSPVDVGRVTSVILDGLQNGQLYFIAVSAYDDQGNALTPELSREVAARPARVYR